MLNQKIENQSYDSSQKCPELACIRSKTLISQQRLKYPGLKHACPVINSLENRRIESKLIVVVVKDQALVIACYLRDRVDPCSIKTMLCKHLFCRVENCLTSTLRVMYPSSSTSRLRHFFPCSFSANLTS